MKEVLGGGGGGGGGSQIRTHIFNGEFSQLQDLVHKVHHNYFIKYRLKG